MNRLLANSLSILNGVFAIGITLAGVYVGFHYWGGSIGAMIGGGIVGFVLAALSCGALAYLALIERHLARIAAATVPPSDPTDYRRSRIEPRA